MKVELKDLVPGTLFVDMTGQFAVVTGRNPRSREFPFLYTNKVWRRSRGCILDGSTYKGKLTEVKAIVGKVDMSALNEAKDEAKSKATLFGSSIEAETMDEFSPFKPDVLKDVKKGDIVLIRHGRSQREVTFEGYKPNRPKYPIQYRIHTGTQYKGPVSAFIRKVRDGVAA